MSGGVLDIHDTKMNLFIFFYCGGHCLYMRLLVPSIHQTMTGLILASIVEKLQMLIQFPQKYLQKEPQIDQVWMNHVKHFSKFLSDPWAIFADTLLSHPGP